MNKECALCGKTHSLFELKLEEDGEQYSRYVCGSCWDVIFAIAKKAAHDAIDYMKATS